VVVGQSALELLEYLGCNSLNNAEEKIGQERTHAIRVGHVASEHNFRFQDVIVLGNRGEYVSELSHAVVDVDLSVPKDVKNG
jgi:hypothetical protein